VTTAVFVVDAGIGSFETLTLKLTVAEAPLAMLPKLHVMVPPCVCGAPCSSNTSRADVIRYDVVGSLKFDLADRALSVVIRD
jgi:hypothetical protein